MCGPMYYIWMYFSFVCTLVPMTSSAPSFHLFCLPSLSSTSLLPLSFPPPLPSPSPYLCPAGETVGWWGGYKLAVLPLKGWTPTGTLTAPHRHARTHTHTRIHTHTRTHAESIPRARAQGVCAWSSWEARGLLL